MTKSTPAPDAVRLVPVSAIVDFDVEDYVSDYEFRADEDGGAYTPTEEQKALITDAIHGVLSDICLLAAAPAPATARGGDALRIAVEALEPFAAFARVAEAKSRMAAGKVLPDHEIVASISWEGGLGVLVMGHFRDALSLAPDAKGWGGLYRRSAALASQPQATGGADKLLQQWVDAFEGLGSGSGPLINETRAHLAALATQPAPSPDGWRTDFENAPKDGSVFLVGYDDETAKKAGLFANKDRVYEARWNETQSTWSARNGFILHSDATHWQPLPAAPSIQKGDEG